MPILVEIDEDPTYYQQKKTQEYTPGPDGETEADGH